METRFRRTLMQFAISAAVAVVTPVAAAGIVEGVSQTASAVTDATAPSIISADMSGGQSAAPARDSRAATHAPMRLSDLAGEDDVAWASAGHKAHAKH
jgi:hypothetical protein